MKYVWALAVGLSVAVAATAGWTWLWGTAVFAFCAFIDEVAHGGG